MSDNNPPPAYDFINDIKNITEAVPSDVLAVNAQQTRMLYNAMHKKMLDYGASSPTCPECGYCIEFNYDEIRQKLTDDGYELKHSHDDINHKDGLYCYTKSINRVCQGRFKSGVHTVNLGFTPLKVNHCEKCKTWIGYYRYHNTSCYGDKFTNSYMCSYDICQWRSPDIIKNMIDLFGEKFIDINLFWISKSGNVYYQNGPSFVDNIIHRIRPVVLTRSSSYHNTHYYLHQPSVDGNNLYTLIETQYKGAVCNVDNELYRIVKAEDERKQEEEEGKRKQGGIIEEIFDADNLTINDEKAVYFKATPIDSCGRYYYYKEENKKIIHKSEYLIMKLANMYRDKGKNEKEKAIRKKKKYTILRNWMFT